MWINNTLSHSSFLVFKDFPFLSKLHLNVLWSIRLLSEQVTNLLFDLLLDSIGHFLSSFFEPTLQKGWEVGFKQLLLQHILFTFDGFGRGAGVYGCAEVDENGNSEDSLD